MNACASCKHGKRKCDKARPACSNCVRLHKTCVYIEDDVHTQFSPKNAVQPRPSALNNAQLSHPLAGISLFSPATSHHSIVTFARHVIGTVDRMDAISTEFFTGTHQRMPAISRIRFLEELQTWHNEPPADFAALCLSILLLQQIPSGKSTIIQSPLYITVKHFINLLQASDGLSLDLVHCRSLVSFYEMGHGLHAQAYVSIAAAARSARALGLHRTMRRDFFDAESNKMTLEERRRLWWGIVIMDRFINLCNGDNLFATDDSERTHPLPIEDLFWSESPSPADIEELIGDSPSLDTPFDITVGQMARESQVSHLTKRVVQHVFDPLSDTNLNIEEGLQLERTLKSYLPLLANEELRIGKYCAAFGIANSTLFTLYEFMLSNNNVNSTERKRVQEEIKETSMRAFTFAEATHKDRFENYPIDTQSPLFTYSIYQAAAVQFRLWKQFNDSLSKRCLDLLKNILVSFSRRWMISFQYLDLLAEDREGMPPIVMPFQNRYISTGAQTIVS